MPGSCISTDPMHSLVSSLSPSQPGRSISLDQIHPFCLWFLFACSRAEQPSERSSSWRAYSRVSISLPTICQRSTKSSVVVPPSNQGLTSSHFLYLSFSRSQSVVVLPGRLDDIGHSSYPALASLLLGVACSIPSILRPRPAVLLASKYSLGLVLALDSRTLVRLNYSFCYCNWTNNQQ